jgi:hypothetical protein
MLIGVNEKHEIKQINTITDESLKVIEVDENEEEFVFEGYSEEKILCYCYKVEGNNIYTYPYKKLPKTST